MKLTIEKVTKRIKGKSIPDYRILYGEQYVTWILEVYPTIFIEKDSRFTSYEIKTGVEQTPDTIKPLYNIIESKGNPSMSLLYKEYLDKEHFRYRLGNFPDLTIYKMISYLVHFTIWEPDKIIWKNYEA